MTIQEIHNEIERNAHHTYVSIRFDRIEVTTRLVREAFAQIEKAISMIQMGVERPEDHRAEALLLMLLNDTPMHGYTPAEVNDAK